MFHECPQAPPSYNLALLLTEIMQQSEAVEMFFQEIHVRYLLQIPFKL